MSCLFNINIRSINVSNTTALLSFNFFVAIRQEQQADFVDITSNQSTKNNIKPAQSGII